MSIPRFEVILDPDALKEYNKLDNSAVEMVDKAIDELEYRADEVGKPLSNYDDTKLAGCKEIKLRLGSFSESQKKRLMFFGLYMS